MKICFFGLGSIGKKHLRNIKIILDENQVKYEIHAFRSYHKYNLENKIEGIDKEIYQREELENDYDIIFITNPTSLHYSTIKDVAQKTKHLFIEKPLFDNISYNLDGLKLNAGVCYVASPLRYTGVVEKIKELITSRKVYSVRSICSSYLPNWRPNQDYREVYSAKKELGGGVSIDLIHEWDYLTYLFGFPKEIYNMQGKFSHLEINSEDLSVYIARYADKLIEVHLDYFGRVPRREVEIYLEDDIIIGDFIKKEIRFLKKEKVFRFDNIDMYIKEMKYFLELIANNKNIQELNSLEHAYNVLKMIKKEKI